VRGQYLVLEPGETILEAYVGDDEHPGGMAYAIPRDGELLVGGTEEPYVARMAFEADVDDMLTRAGEFLSVDLGALERTRSVVGLRPCRTSRHVRFGWDPEIPQVFHNYGHGGSGFSLAWGCAEDVTHAVAVARQASGNRNAGSERQ
jgi:D-amino-acid oxidase